LGTFEPDMAYADNIERGFRDPANPKVGDWDVRWVRLCTGTKVA
jgi:hypothetical protein